MNSFKEEKCRGNVYPNSQKIVAVMYTQILKKCRGNIYPNFQKIVAVMSCYFWNCRGNVLRPWKQVTWLKV